MKTNKFKKWLKKDLRNYRKTVGKFEVERLFKENFLISYFKNKSRIDLI